MKTNNQKLTLIQEALSDDFADILNDTRSLSQNALKDFELGIIQHTYLNKATATSLEADIRLMIPELENLSNRLQDLLTKTDEMTENLSKYLGD